MTDQKHLQAFIDKMKGENLPQIVIDTFAYYYDKVVTGETGMIPDREIEPVAPDEIARYSELEKYTDAGKKALSNAVLIILNGGLGTSMGLTGPKSLLEVRNGKSFLEILLNQAAEFDVTLALMNSFSTHEETMAALKELNPPKMPLTFLQHKFPKILQENLTPAQWPGNPDLEWNPPGHGDLYTALETSGMLNRLLTDNIVYAFVSNCDNLGSAMNHGLLGYFAEKGFPFMMEVAERTPADVKGGHLARYKDGRLILRESAQCPDDEMDAFTDINRYRFFNTNNLWVNLKHLKDLIEEQKTVRLPMILNPKSLDPRDDDGSPPVYQVETAMGAAISLFEGATAVSVPRSRFFPVKKCNDLLLVRSDYFILKEGKLVLNPDRKTDRLNVQLDSRFYKKIDQFEARFPEGPPSLVECASLTVEGDVRFEIGVKARGHVVVRNPNPEQKIIPSGTIIEGDVNL